MTPQAAAVLLEAERLRILAIIDKRIAGWEQFFIDYDDEAYNLGADLVIAELDYIRSRIDDRRSKAGRS